MSEYTMDGIQMAKRENPSYAVARCMNKTLMFTILRLHGIPTPRRSAQVEQTHTVQSIATKYVIPVFQTEALGLFEIKASDGWKQFSHIDDVSLESVHCEEPSRQMRVSTRLAQRAVYSLGLNYGVVYTGVLENGRIGVLDVDLGVEDDSLKPLFMKAFEQFDERASGISCRDVILGTDPEFMLRNRQGNMVLASHYFKIKGEVGCDAVWIRGTDRTRKPIAELRPSPAFEPKQLIVNLYRTMLKASKRINDDSIEWVAGAMPFDGYSLGGHIHISNIQATAHLIRCLDNYLALSLMLIEDENGTKRRPAYGFLGDCRAQFHGGFEYRTLASWLTSPKVTKGVFALSKVIAQNSDRLTQNPLRSLQLQLAYYRGDKKLLLPYVMRLWEEISLLDDYRLYVDYLEPFREAVLSMQPISEQEDIRKRWRLPPFHIREI